MMRQPFINWNYSKDNKPTKPGMVYMIAIPMDDKVQYEFAKFYEKGDVITIPLTEEAARATMPEKATVEERLLNTIFGSTYKYTAPVSAFYLKYPNSPEDFNDEANTFKNCEYSLDIFEEVYWAEVPVAPEGFITENEAENRMKADAEQRAARYESKKCAQISDMIEADHIMKSAYDVITSVEVFGKTVPGINMDIKNVPLPNGGIYSLSTYNVAQAVSVSKQIMNVIEHMIENDQSYDIIEQNIKEIVETSNTEKEYTSKIDEIMLSVLKDVSTSPAADRIVKTTLYDLRNGYPALAIYRTRAMNRYEHDESRFQEIVLYEDCWRQVVGRFTRLYRLSKIQMPAIIAENEFRLLVHNVMQILFANQFVGVNEERFAVKHGVTVDGLQYEPEEDPDDEEDGIEEVDKTDEFEEDDSENGGLGVDYPYFAAVTSPYWAMFEGDFTIRDNEHGTFITDDSGHIITFKNLEDAFKYKESHGMNK